jgi:hypothetical protein
MTASTALAIAAPTASVIAAVIAAVASVAVLVGGFFVNKRIKSLELQAGLDIETHKSGLAASQAAETRAEDARRLMARYRDPLLRTAYDFQSRLYNILRPGGFRGGRDPEYFQTNTLFVMAEFLGWLEIIRRDMQFLDIGAVEETRELNARVGKVQDRLAHTSNTSDPFYLYRGQQRAIGELMLSPVTAKGSPAGPQYETVGYVAFCARMRDGDYAKWFDRFGKLVPELPERKSTRLGQVQHALIDLIDMLDSGCQWYQGGRDRLQLPALGCTCSACTRVATERTAGR